MRRQFPSLLYSNIHVIIYTLKFQYWLTHYKKQLLLSTSYTFSTHIELLQGLVFTKYFISNSFYKIFHLKNRIFMLVKLPMYNTVELCIKGITQR